MYSLNKLYKYFKLVIVIIIILNSNTTRNIKPYYYISDISMNYILIFSSSVHKIYSDRFSTKFIFKIFISILIKYNNNNLAIVFVFYNDF